MKKIIAFCGVIGSGKDYEANKYIQDGYKLINFADALKKILFKTLKIKNIDHQKYELFKDSHWNPVGMFPSVTGRDLLQLGNYARHIIDEDIWINAWEKSIQNESLIVTSDCRYLNEAKKIISLGGEIFFCNYKSLKYNSKTHFESEKLSQDLLKNNFQHGENITQYFIKKINEVNNK
jgi:hypothetical protein